MAKPVLSVQIPGGRVRVYYDGIPTRRFWQWVMTTAAGLSRTPSAHSMSVQGIRFEADEDADWEALKAMFKRFGDTPEEARVSEMLESKRAADADKDDDGGDHGAR